MRDRSDEEVPDVAEEMYGASPTAIRHHYDTGNAFYALWLDPTLTYSGAMYSDNPERETLERAQIRKLDFHVGEAKAQRVGRVLDVGCGWGSLLRRLVEVHGVERAVGLTLSEAQAKWVRELGLSRVSVAVQSWKDHVPTEPYDAIISLGAIEHFAKPELSVPNKIAAYREFFESCHRWLRPGGWMSLQAIAYGNMKREDFSKGFVAREIFPESEFVALSELADASARLFEIVRVRNDPEDYERTCAAWLANLQARRADAVRAAGEEQTDRYERYLEMSVRGWKLRATNLLRMTFRRIDRPRV